MEHRGSMEDMEDMEDMGEQIERDEDGWVAIETLLTFIFSSKRFQIVWIGESLAQ